MYVHMQCKLLLNFVVFTEHGYPSVIQHEGKDAVTMHSGLITPLNCSWSQIIAKFTWPLKIIRGY